MISHFPFFPVEEGGREGGEDFPSLFFFLLFGPFVLSILCSITELAHGVYVVCMIFVSVWLGTFFKSQCDRLLHRTCTSAGFGVNSPVGTALTLGVSLIHRGTALLPLE